MPPDAICSEIAKLAGVTWDEKVSLGPGRIGPAKLDELDPFFDALGSWEPQTRAITIDRDRCTRARKHFHLKGDEDILNAVAVHFCAKAVVHLGVHPETGKQYVDWDDPQRTFANEGYPMKPNHRFYDPLVRIQELFINIFGYGYFYAWKDEGALAAFKKLSAGHCGLYGISYEAPQRDGDFVRPNSIRLDWLSEIDTGLDPAMKMARHRFGFVTRDVLITKRTLLYEENASL